MGPGTHFYEVVAQVLPVLLLIVAIGDSRVRMQAGESVFILPVYLCFVVLLVFPWFEKRLI